MRSERRRSEAQVRRRSEAKKRGEAKSKVDVKKKKIKATSREVVRRSDD
jgi:hypothetical protein